MNNDELMAWRDAWHDGYQTAIDELRKCPGGAYTVDALVRMLERARPRYHELGGDAALADELLADKPSSQQAVRLLADLLEAAKP